MLLLGWVGHKVAAGATTPVVVVRGRSDRSGRVLAAIRDDNDLGCARAAAREALGGTYPAVWSRMRKHM